MFPKQKKNIAEKIPAKNVASFPLQNLPWIPKECPSVILKKILSGIVSKKLQGFIWKFSPRTLLEFPPTFHWFHRKKTWDNCPVISRVIPSRIFETKKSIIKTFYRIPWKIPSGNLKEIPQGTSDMHFSVISKILS